MCPLGDVEDILPVVLSYLDSETLFQTARCVSRKWYHAVTEKQCSVFHFQTSNPNFQKQLLFLHGRFACIADKPHSRKPPKCLPGRLPEPRMDYDHGTTRDRCLVNVASSGNQIYHSPLQNKRTLQGRFDHFVALDLILSLNGSETGRVPVTKANLSLLSKLKQVSSRWSSCLTHLSISTNLHGLNVSGSTKLQKLLIPSIGGRGGELDTKCQIRSLNLNGCWSLRTIEGLSWTTLASNLQEVDLSSCSQFQTQDICSLLEATSCLRNLSLRYVGTDEILIALSKSKSASRTLHLMDIAFSNDVTDAGVATLVDKAIHLEHLNLRLCDNVSLQCRTETPLFLTERHHQRKLNETTISSCVDITTINGGTKRNNLFQMMMLESKRKRHQVEDVEQRKVVVY